MGHSPAAGPPPFLLQLGCHSTSLHLCVLIAKMGTRVVTPVELRAACKGVVGVRGGDKWVHTVPSLLPLSWSLQGDSGGPLTCSEPGPRPREGVITARLETAVCGGNMPAHLDLYMYQQSV